MLTGQTFEIEAHAVVNATGPWSDTVRRMSDGAASARLAPTKGIHLVIPRVAQEGLFVQHRDDGRRIFILPWQNYSLVGTTETPVNGAPGELRAEPDEAAYLLAAVNRALPGARLGAQDVVASFAGARPLLAHGGTATRASREHQLEVDRSGLISILGGKFTTYRLMAKQVVDLVVSRLPVAAEQCLTGQVMLTEPMSPTSAGQWDDLTRGIDPDLMGRLLVRYGAGAVRVLQLMAQDPPLGRPLCPHHEHVAAELVYGMQAEMAWTVTDLLARRTRIAWSSCQGLDALSTVSSLLSRYGRTPQPVIQRQLEEYQQFLAAGLGFRRHRSGTEAPVSNGHTVAANSAQDSDD
jgi:glycerol-3-phosphate dehydrogenase